MAIFGLAARAKTEFTVVALKTAANSSELARVETLFSKTKVSAVGTDVSIEVKYITAGEEHVGAID